MHGILIVDKPAGITSMTAVSIVRRKVTDERHAKVGHAGTLDPLATGVLVMAIGRATAAIDRLMATDKRYETSIDLSAFTTTDDREGQRSEITVAQPPTHERIAGTLARFTGEFRQRPPDFSAVKVGGQRAYALARRGENVQVETRAVRVHDLRLVHYRWPLVDLEIHCAKGFYVRSLARDLGEALGTGGHCASIRRTAVGPFTLDMARRLHDLPNRLQDDDLLPIDTALAMVAQASTPSA
jgi:tRNA pseudouridine55 synthase